VFKSRRRRYYLFFSRRKRRDDKEYHTTTNERRVVCTSYSDNIWSEDSSFKTVGGKRFPCYRNIIQINITTETCTRVILAGTQHRRGYWRCTRSSGARCRRPIIYVCVVYLSRSPSVRVGLSLSLSLCLSLSASRRFSGPTETCRPCFYPSFFNFLLFYSIYTLLLLLLLYFLGKRPVEKSVWRAGHDVPSSSCASQYTGPARAR